MTPLDYFILTADGGSRGNPGPAAFGFAIWKIENIQPIIQQNYDTLFQSANLVFSKGDFLGEMTNNQAEWIALREGLIYFINNFKTDKLYIFLDSELVVKQLLGVYKVKNIELQNYKTEVMGILKDQKFEIKHFFRKHNVEADLQANLALDLALKFSPE
jgi:ribonuclease HI